MDKNLVIIFVFISLALWFWAIGDIAKSRFKSTTMNLVWLLIVIIFPVFGSFFYLILRNNQIKKEPRKFNPKFNR